MVRKVRILFVTANPHNTARLQLDEEIRAITEKIRSSEYRDFLELISVWATRPDDLLQALNVHKPNIIHFSGHGSNQGEIVLMDSSGQAKPVTPEALEALFTVLKDNVRVVVLNACYSHIQARAITSAIDCAIGMKDSINDHAAIIFAASFYRAIGFGRSIKEAFDQAKVSLMLDGIPEDDVPEILIKKGIDPIEITLIGSNDPNGNHVNAAELTEAEPAKLKYICYLSFGKINNLFEQIPLSLRQQVQPDSTAKTSADYDNELLNLIFSGIGYGGRGQRGYAHADDSLDPIRKLTYVLRTLEESKQIGDLNRLISLNDKLVSSDATFFTYSGVFNCLADDALSEFLNVQNSYVKSEEQEAEYSPLQFGLKTTGGMSILHSVCGSYKLYLACSYKYFSDMGGSRVFVEGHNNFSENDLVSIHPHSGNWHFFNGKYDATFDVILLLTGQKDYELYGSALVIVNAFSPNFNI